MKTKTLIYIGLLSLLLSGCIVKSLHPFFTESDVVYKEKLIGTWMDSDSTIWTIKPYVYSKGFMRGDTTDNSYLVEFMEEPGEPQTFNVHLFELEGELFLDFLPETDNYKHLMSMHFIPTHSLARLSENADGTIDISWFNEEWLEELFEENRIKISHEKVKGNYGKSSIDSYQGYILTASTPELQKFILKYAINVQVDDCEENDNFICTNLKRINQ